MTPIPIAMGASMTSAVEHAMPRASMGMMVPNASLAIMGVMMQQPMVVAEVIIMERATSPSAMKVQRLLAWPPLMAPTRTMPASMGCERPKSLLMSNARAGQAVKQRANWRLTGTGRLSTRLRSVTVRVIPMKSILQAGGGVGIGWW